MSFATLRFGETSLRHAAPQSRGADNRCYADPMPRRVTTANTVVATAGTASSTTTSQLRADQPVVNNIARPVERFVADTSTTRPNTTAGQVLQLAPISQPPIVSPATATPLAATSSPKPVKLIDVAEADAAFKRCDVNGNGMLSLAEVDKAVVEKWPQFNNKAVLMRAFRASDTNNSGFLSKTEFRAFMQHVSRFSALHGLFASVDRDGDRRLTKHEFVAAFHRDPAVRAACNGDDPEAIFQSVDRDRAGKVLFDEFCAFILGDATVNSKARFASTVARTQRSASQKAALKPTAITLPSDSELIQHFNRADINRNGVLSLAEVDKLVVEMWPQYNNKPALLRAFKAADLSRNGLIGKREFKTLVANLVAYNKAFEAFKAVDTSGDRRISRDEFVAGCSAIGLRLSTVELEARFVKADKNRGGMLLFDEFCDVMLPDIVATIQTAQSTLDVGVVEDGVVCYLCGTRRSWHSLGAHHESCLASTKTHILALPTCLRPSLPKPPVLPAQPSAKSISLYNAEAAHVATYMTTIQCPECARKMPLPAMASHFKGHNISGAREAELAARNRAVPKFIDTSSHQPSLVAIPAVQEMIAAAGFRGSRLLHKSLRSHFVSCDSYLDAKALHAVVAGCGVGASRLLVSQLISEIPNVSNGHALASAIEAALFATVPEEIHRAIDDTVRRIDGELGGRIPVANIMARSQWAQSSAALLGCHSGDLAAEAFRQALHELAAASGVLLTQLRGLLFDVAHYWLLRGLNCTRFADALVQLFPSPSAATRDRAVIAMTDASEVVVELDRPLESAKALRSRLHVARAIPHDSTRVRLMSKDEK